MGLSTAKLVASKGASLSLCDVNVENLAAAEKLFKEGGTPILTKVVDVTDSKQVDQWITGTVQEVCQTIVLSNHLTFFSSGNWMAQ